MNYIDIIIAIPVLLGIIKGFSRGLISEVAQLAALVLGCLLGAKFSYFISHFLIESLGLKGSLIPAVSFLIVFIAVIICVILLARVLTKMTKSVALGWLNRAGGILFGGLKFLLITGIIFQMIITNDTAFRVVSLKTREESVLLSPTLSAANFFTPYLKKALFDSEIATAIKMETPEQDQHNPE